MRFPVWLMRLFRLKRPIMDFPATPFLVFWSGEIVRHMGRLKQPGNIAIAGHVREVGRNFIVIQWEDDLDHWERISDPSVLPQIIKQPLPAMSQL